MSEVQEATEFILIGKIISRNVLIDGWFIITHAHACLHIICRRMHHRTYTLSEPLSLSLSLLKQGFLLLPLYALHASWCTAFWLIPLPLPPIFSEESRIIDACFHVHSLLDDSLASLPPIFSESWIIDTCFHVDSLCEFWRPNSGHQAWAGITWTHRVICQPRFWDFSHFCYSLPFHKVIMNNLIQWKDPDFGRKLMFDRLIAPSCQENNVSSVQVNSFSVIDTHNGVFCHLP